MFVTQYNEGVGQRLSKQKNFQSAKISCGSPATKTSGLPKLRLTFSSYVCINWT
jgi:hypothetical protein